MKRIITLFSAVALFTTLNAQEFAAIYNGEKIADGATLIVNGFEGTTGIWQSNPSIVLTASTDVNVGLKTSYTDSHIQFCPKAEIEEFGGCIPPSKMGDLFIAQKSFDMGPDNSIDLAIHWADDMENLGSPTKPNVLSEVAFSVIYHTRTVYSFTIQFNSNYTAGIDNVADNSNFVNLAAGNILEYNVPAGTKLDVYSLNGATVLERTINGHGSLSLDRLAPGVYLYKAGELSGKVLVK